jgi:hypothetical protein
MYINEKTYLVKGDLYTSMNFDVSLLDRSENSITIHVKKDIHFGVIRPPRKLEDGDEYIDYEVFILHHGPIRDLIAFSKI